MTSPVIERDASLRLSAQVFFQLPALVPMVEVLHRLFQADGDQQPKHDGGDVNEKVAPRAGGVVGIVDIDHLRLLLLSRGRGHFGLALKGRDFSPAISATNGSGL